MSTFSVLTDAQSKGIVRRLVSYHEEAQNDLSHRNRYVYNRVGDFPIVHLKKTELKRNLVRSSSVRIAPPNKFNYNREARAAILRSNSFQLGNGLLSSMTPRVAPVKMRSPDSHQIITNHEPIMFNENAHSTNNVLEDLEKNCRKRINIEELCMDKSKRIALPSMPEPLSEIPIVDISSLPSQPIKRAREPISPDKGGNSVTDSPISQQVKRLKIRNNAYLSSLSSSHHELIPKKSFVRPTIIRNTAPQPKPIERTQIAPTPRVEPQPAPAAVQPQPIAVKKLRLFNVEAKQPPPSFRSKFRRNLNDDDDDDEFKINFVKPKEKPSNIDTEANKSMEREKLSRMLHSVGDGLSRTTTEYTSDTVDAAKTAKKVSFSPTVDTKSIGGSIATVNFAASDSTASKLTLPTTITEKKDEKSTDAEKTAEKPVEKESTLPTTIAKIPTLNFGVGSSSAASTTSITSPPKPALPQLDASKSLISFSPAPAAAKETTSSTATKPATSDSAPVLGGFSFSAPKDASASLAGIQFKSPTSSSVASVMSNSPSSLTTLAVSTAAPSIAFGASSVPITAPPSFFAPATVASTTTTTALPPTTFSFGKTSTEVKPSTTESTNSSAQPAISAAAPPSYSFGQQNKPETTQSSGVGFSFGTSTFSAAPATTTAGTTAGFSFGSNTDKPTTTTPAPGGFSFGASAAKPAAPSTGGMFGMPQTNATPAATPTPNLNMFQSAIPSTTPAGSIASPSKTGGIFSRLSDKVPEVAAPAPSTGSFQFGLNKAPTPTFGLDTNKPANEVKPFSFGGDKKSESAVPTFGASLGNNNDVSKPQALSGFSFGAQSKPAETNSAFSFGGDKPADKPTFAFGGAAKTAEVKPSFSFGATMPNEKQDAPVAFSFGGAKPIIENKIENIAKPTMFGSTATVGQPSIFGSAAKQDAPSPFGSAAQTPTFGQSAFNAPSTTPVFGASTQQNPPAFGAASPPSGGMLFGNNNNPPSFNQSQTQGGGFGQSNTSNNNTMFSFNASSKNDLNAQPAQNAPAAGGIFSFGGAAPAPTNNNQQPANVFGSSGQNVSASFSFKPSTGTVSNNNPPSNMFGSTQNNGQSAFQFGQNVTNASASFTFSPPSASSANSQSSGFNFGAPQTAPVVPNGNAFNFQAQQQPGAMMPGANQGGMFSIGVGGQQKRPFRQAARRLK